MGKPLKPAWRETPILYGEDARRFMKRMEIAAVILLQMSFEVLLFFLFIFFFITTAKVQKIYETDANNLLTLLVFIQLVMTKMAI